MPMYRPAAALVAGAIALTAAASAASAQTSFTVAPPAFADTDGSLISDGPLGMAGANASGRRYQQVYSADFFGGSPGSPVTISEIQFRAANTENTFRPNSITASDTRITLSTTSSAANAAGIAGSFDSNVGGDVQVVYDGPLTLDRGGSNPSGQPQPFSYGFTLEMPFDYDPSMGNLLLDVTVPAGSPLTAGPGFGAVESFDATVDQPDVDGIASKTGDFGAGSGGLITRFTTAPVPEPTTAGLALGAAAMLGLRRRRA